MDNNILIINAGSSSIKFQLISVSGKSPKTRIKGQVSGIGTSPDVDVRDGEGQSLAFPGAVNAIANHDDAFDVVLGWLRDRDVSFVAAGHRVVHGGTGFTAPVLIDHTILEKLDALSPLAPQHQPHNVRAIRALSRKLPELAQVACFDTAFHATMPFYACHSGLPQAVADKGIRRYGFHGLSYQSIIDNFTHKTGQPVPGRMVIAHLGNGASMCAVKDGKSIATTMGFSTLDGLPMATRCGSVDPGVLLHLMREDGADIQDLEDMLYNRSGLLGLSGISQDMKVLLASDNKQAREAVTFFCYQVSRHLGSLVAALGGLDALVFTGGIGENAAEIRERVLKLSQWLGLDLDETANRTGGRRLTLNNSPATAWIINTDEEKVIAGHTRQILDL